MVDDPWPHIFLFDVLVQHELANVQLESRSAPPGSRWPPSGTTSVRHHGIMADGVIMEAGDDVRFGVVQIPALATLRHARGRRLDAMQCTASTRTGQGLGVHRGLTSPLADMWDDRCIKRGANESPVLVPRVLLSRQFRSQCVPCTVSRYDVSVCGAPDTASRLFLRARTFFVWEFRSSLWKVHGPLLSDPTQCQHDRFCSVV